MGDGNIGMYVHMCVCVRGSADGWALPVCVCVCVRHQLHGLSLYSLSFVSTMPLFLNFRFFVFVGWFLTFSTQGSGGTNGALDHFNATGQQYPLVVKLGTITSDISTADCYSYAPDEDGPVKIPNLVDLLSKRGIKVASMYVSAKFCFLLHYR